MPWILKNCNNTQQSHSQSQCSNLVQCNPVYVLCQSWLEKGNLRPELKWSASKKTSCGSNRLNSLDGKEEFNLLKMWKHYLKLKSKSKKTKMVNLQLLSLSADNVSQWDSVHCCSNFQTMSIVSQCQYNLNNFSAVHLFKKLVQPLLLSLACVMCKNTAACRQPCPDWAWRCLGREHRRGRPGRRVMFLHRSSVYGACKAYGWTVENMSENYRLAN